MIGVDAYIDKDKEIIRVNFCVTKSYEEQLMLKQNQNQVHIIINETPACIIQFPMLLF